MANPVVHFEVLGRDREALQRFYTSAFSWDLGPTDEQYTMINPGEGIQGGVGAAAQGDGHVTFYVSVDDAQHALTRIEGLGGRTVVEPTRLPSGKQFALFADPEGHLVGLLGQ